MEHQNPLFHLTIHKSIQNISLYCFHPIPNQNMLYKYSLFDIRIE